MKGPGENSEPRRSSPLKEKVMRLRRVYLAKLPHVLAQAKNSCVLLAENEADERILYDLHCMFHNIKGTASSLGLPEISAEGELGTALVLQLQHLDSAERKAILPQKLQRLKSSLVRLENLSRDQAREYSSDAVAPSSSDDDAAPQISAPPRRTIVFLCDEDLEGERIGAQLSRFGYSYSSFIHPQDLRAAIIDQPPDALVISTAAAAMVPELRKETNTPVLFVSDQCDFESRLKAVRSGGQAYFIKPVTAHEILEFLDNVTNRTEPEPFRVLIVDDEPEVADYHALILQGAGMITRGLGNPAQILDALAEFKPDLLLMDLYMHDCTGHELSQVIRQMPEFVSLPIIFLSSETDKRVQVSALGVGADGFLTKPILPEDLVTAVAVRAQRTRALRSQLIQDSLTGLLNHTALSQFLDTSLALARRNKRRLCFGMLDVDNFKKINDTYGHPAGDHVLVTLARMLKQRLRNSDTAGRYGGEEFAVVLPDVSLEDAKRIIDQIRHDFAALTFAAGNKEFSCSFSGGVAELREAESAYQIVQAADRALYSAKHAGRNLIHTAESHKESCRSMALHKN